MFAKEKDFLKEEKINSFIHGFGAFLSVIAVFVLMFSANAVNDFPHLISCSIYGATLIILYLASTFFHGAVEPKIKKKLEIVDHCCVFLLIAGTYTPFTMIVLKGSFGLTMFITIWTLAIIGIIYKIFFIDKFEKLSLLFYLGMGWVSVISVKEIMTRIPFNGVLLLFIGGLFYTFGTLFYAMDKRPYFHPIWHIMVIGGSISHYIMILKYILPIQS